MKIITNGRNIELTDAIKTAVVEKLSRLEKHYDFIQEIHVILSVEKNPRIHDAQIAEATVHVPGQVLHLETAHESLYASIDELVDKIERSLKKHKTKLNPKHEGQSIRHLNDDGVELEDDDLAELDETDKDADVEIVAVESN